MRSTAGHTVELCSDSISDLAWTVRSVNSGRFLFENNGSGVAVSIKIS